MCFVDDTELCRTRKVRLIPYKEEIKTSLHYPCGKEQTLIPEFNSAVKVQTFYIEKLL